MNINGRTMEELEQRRYSTFALIAAYFAKGGLGPPALKLLKGLLHDRKGDANLQGSQ
jgi:hypothetical protein